MHRKKIDEREVGGSRNDEVRSGRLCVAHLEHEPIKRSGIHTTAKKKNQQSTPETFRGGSATKTERSA